jgi:hypothetical protein
MTNPAIPPQGYRVLTIGLLLAVGLTACGLLPAQAPVIQTVQVTQVVTQLVTQEVTRDVTRIVEVPVTVTPTETPVFTYTPTLSPTISPIPTITPTAEPPIVTVIEDTNCLYGPGAMYLYKYGLRTSDLMEVIGRNMEGTWLYVQVVHGWNPCWIDANLIRFDTGDITTVPIVYSMLPYSNQYQPPIASAERKDSVVTIYWKAVWMTTDDYRGYLIEAWVCQGGTQVFVPIGYAPTYAQNAGTLGVQVTDEPGCGVPSSARIYVAEKHGYSPWRKIPWPDNPAVPTPTPTLNPTLTSTPTQ